MNNADPLFGHVYIGKCTLLLYYIGESEFWQCSDYTITPDIAQITKLHRSPRSPDGGKVGITMTTFLSQPVGAPVKAWHKPMSYPNMDGRTVVSSKCRS